jgi:arsenate reductase-like glutaredoxin family protein
VTPSPRASGSADAPIVQVFGRADSQATRRCRRFFSERRIGVTFVDLSRRPLAPAELRRFSDRFGAAALLDPESRAYRKVGLAYLRMDDAEVLSRLLADPSLLRLPLVRQGTRLSVGMDEDAWKAWLRDVL